MDYRHLLAVTLVTPALLLTACHASTPTADPPRVAPSATSPTPARETPQHFIRRWARAEKAMENTGHTREYLALSHGCSACRKLAKTVAGIYGSGGFIHWGGWAIQAIRRYPSTGSSISFSIRSLSAPTRYRRTSHTPEVRLAGGEITYVLRLVPASGPFHVARKTQLGR